MLAMQAGATHPPSAMQQLRAGSVAGGRAIRGRLIRPAAAGLLKCASSRPFFWEQALNRKAMRRRLATPASLREAAAGRALPTPKDFASRKHFPHTGGQAVQNALHAF